MKYFLAALLALAAGPAVAAPAPFFRGPEQPDVCGRYSVTVGDTQSTFVFQTDGQFIAGHESLDADGEVGFNTHASGSWRLHGGAIYVTIERRHFLAPVGWTHLYFRPGYNVAHLYGEGSRPMSMRRLP